MAALRSRCEHYIFVLLLLFFPRLISAVTDWMSTILYMLSYACTWMNTAACTGIISASSTLVDFPVFLFFASTPARGSEKHHKLPKEVQAKPGRQMLLMVLRLKTINPVYLDYIIQNKLGIVTTNVGIITTNIVQAT